MGLWNLFLHLWLKLFTLMYIVSPDRPKAPQHWGYNTNPTTTTTTTTTTSTPTTSTLATTTATATTIPSPWSTVTGPSSPPNVMTTTADDDNGTLDEKTSVREILGLSPNADTEYVLRYMAFMVKTYKPRYESCLRDNSAFRPSTPPAISPVPETAYHGRQRQGHATDNAAVKTCARIQASDSSAQSRDYMRPKALRRTSQEQSAPQPPRHVEGAALESPVHREWTCWNYEHAGHLFCDFRKQTTLTVRQGLGNRTGSIDDAGTVSRLKGGFSEPVKSPIRHPSAAVTLVEISPVVQHGTLKAKPVFGPRPVPREVTDRLATMPPEITRRLRNNQKLKVFREDGTFFRIRTSKLRTLDYIY